MKIFLRKAIIAVVAMIASVNVMAQSLELKKSSDLIFFNEENIAVFPEFTKDGNPRLLIADFDEEEDFENGRWAYRHILNKLSIWDNNLNIEKEFTSGALFEEYADVTVTYAGNSPDELEEVERYTSSVRSAFYADQVWYYNFFYESETGVTITQTLFNNDEKYEFCLPVMDVFTKEDSYSDYYQTQTIHHRYEPIGYKIVSEDGTVLQEIIVNEARDNNLSIYAVVMPLGDKTYFVIGTYSGEYGEEHKMTYFYEINKNTNSIQKVREVKGSMRVTPTVANRNEEITISINDDNCNVARELIITGVNGKLIERRTIPAGENTFKVNAAMMRSGMYNFTLQKKGEFVDNNKVIVK